MTMVLSKPSNSSGETFLGSFSFDPIRNVSIIPVISNRHKLKANQQGILQISIKGSFIDLKIHIQVNQALRNLETNCVHNPELSLPVDKG